MNTPTAPAIAAVVAAAGFSRRMGCSKQLLPWGDGTVIEAVVRTLRAAGAAPVLVVTGHRGAEIAAALAPTCARIVPNPDYRQDEMLRSYQVGVQALSPHLAGALLALGDQPHIPVDVVRRILVQARRRPDAIVIPSHRHRRGHPIYLPRPLWPDLLASPPGATLRDTLNRCQDAIVYVDVATDAIRRDMDWPGEYEMLRREYTDTRR